MTWYLRMVVGANPNPLACVTQSCTVEGRICDIDMVPKYGRKCLSR